MQHKNQVVLSCEKMVVDRVKRSTILHLNTRDLLNNEIKILKQNLKKEIEMKHRERGQLEGRIISLETLLTKNKNKRVELENKLNENEKKRLLEIDVYTIDRNEYELRETLHFQDMLKCQTLLNNLQSCYQQTNNETTDTLFALANEANRVVANHPLSRFNGDNGLGGSGYRYSDTTTTATTTAALNTAATTSTTSTTSTFFLFTACPSLIASTNSEKSISPLPSGSNIVERVEKSALLTRMPMRSNPKRSSVKSQVPSPPWSTAEKRSDSEQLLFFTYASISANIFATPLGISLILFIFVACCYLFFVHGSDNTTQRSNSILVLYLLS